MLPLAKKQEEEHKKQKFCHICKQEFYDINATENSRRVWDYCQYTRKFRDVAHDMCNLKYKTPR